MESLVGKAKTLGQELGSPTTLRCRKESGPGPRQPSTRDDGAGPFSVEDCRAGKEGICPEEDPSCGQRISPGPTEGIGILPQLLGTLVELPSLGIGNLFPSPPAPKFPAQGLAQRSDGNLHDAVPKGQDIFPPPLDALTHEVDFRLPLDELNRDGDPVPAPLHTPLHDAPYPKDPGKTVQWDAEVPIGFDAVSGDHLQGFYLVQLVDEGLGDAVSQVPKLTARTEVVEVEDGQPGGIQGGFLGRRRPHRLRSGSKPELPTHPTRPTSQEEDQENQRGLKGRTPEKLNDCGGCDLDYLRSLDPLDGEIESPGQDQNEGEKDHHHRHDDSDNCIGIGDGKDREDGGGHLDQSPSSNRVDRNSPEDMAAFQLRQEHI